MGCDQYDQFRPGIGVSGVSKKYASIGDPAQQRKTTPSQFLAFPDETTECDRLIVLHHNCGTDRRFSDHRRDHAGSRIGGGLAHLLSDLKRYGSAVVDLWLYVQKDTGRPKL